MIIIIIIKKYLELNLVIGYHFIDLDSQRFLFRQGFSESLGSIFLKIFMARSQTFSMSVLKKIVMAQWM